MDNRQNAKFKMYQAVEKICTAFASEIATNAAFKSESEEFVALIPEIRRVDSLIGDDRTFVAANKNQVKETMVGLTLDVLKNIKAVGIKTNDETLKSLGSTTKSSLTTGKEEQCLQNCERIAKKAREILTALNERGMDSSMLEDLETTITDFKDKKSEPLHVQQEKSAMLTQLTALFDKADNLVDLMELTLVNFKKSNPDFCARFDAATTIQTPITKTTKAKFLPENELTGELLNNFNVECPTIGFTAFVNGNGNPAFEIGSHKDAQIVFSKEGFQSITLDHVKITRGQLNKIVARLQPVLVSDSEIK